MCKRKKLGASGQATLEYIFLIFFTIVLISGFVYQFNGAVRGYFQGYFAQGGYLACLIEKGLLPGESNDEGACEPPTFNMSGAAKREVASVNFGNGPGLNYNGVGNGGTLAGTSGRLNEGYGGSVPTGAAGGGAFKKDGKAGGAGKKESGNDTGNNGFSSSNVTSTSSVEEGGGRHGDRIPYRATASSEPTSKKDSNVPATNRDLKTARQVATEKAQRKLKSNKTASSFDLSFGNVLKWIFLILILFAIIFFIGSQMLAISNGGKKRQ